MARNTSNLILRVWDSLLDQFNHVELADNWDKLDAHDHTGSGKGLKIPAGGLANGAVTSSSIADDSVSTAKLANSAVTEAKLSPGSVTTTRVKDSAITSRKAALTTLQANASAPVFAGASWADVTGATVTFTPEVPSLLLVVASFDFDFNLSSNDEAICEGGLVVDGSVQTKTAPVRFRSLAGNSLRMRTTASQSWIVPLSAAEHTVKLQLKLTPVVNPPFGEVKALNPATSFSGILFAQ